MKLTPLERRDRIHRLAQQDGEYQRMMADFATARKAFMKYTDKRSPRIRNLLWCFSGMGYFLHHRMLTVICEHMRFEDEE